MQSYKLQSYKLRKTSETALFPIEYQLKLLRQENDKSWTLLMLKILSVIFSGVGTTVLCQENCIPALVQYIFCNILKKEIPMGWLIAIQSLAAIGLFVLLSFITIKIINLLNLSKDNKKNDSERENLAEVFHKIILNNIITGKSFTKKAQSKYNELQKYNTDTEGEGAEREEKAKEIKGEFCLYLSEALYYFMIADRQITKEKIIEIGNRDNYQNFLDEVGILTLAESLFMYEKSINELKSLLMGLDDIDTSLWEPCDLEDLSITEGIKKVEEIIKNILDWKINLKNTVKELYPCIRKRNEKG